MPLIFTDIASLLVLLMVPLLVIGPVMATAWACQFMAEKRIAEVVIAMGATPLRIAPVRAWYQHDCKYEVRMQMGSGRTLTAICEYQPFCGVYWKSAPCPLNEEAATGAEESVCCSECHSPVLPEWRYCPNCGKAKAEV